MGEEQVFEEKKLLKGKNLIVAAASSQGKRPYMQDVFAIVLQHVIDPQTDFLGVFDGHGVNGEKVAHFVGRKLGDKVLKNLVEVNYNNAQSVVTRAFIDLDEELRNDESLKNSNGEVSGGTTAVGIWIKNGRMIVAHVGDSRAIMSVGGKAMTLTEDHKPADVDESRRIFQAGGFVYMNRVKGVLAVSRAFGDFRFKTNAEIAPEDQMVSAKPDVSIVETTDELDFIVLASDGIYDVLNNQVIVNIIQTRLAENWPLDMIAMDVMKRCIAPPTPFPNIGKDNVTIIIALPVKQE